MGSVFEFVCVAAGVLVRFAAVLRGCFWTVVQFFVYTPSIYSLNWWLTGFLQKPTVS